MSFFISRWRFHTILMYKERTVLLMDSVTLLLLACGLAMDAFAVSLSNGLCYQNFRRSQAILSAVTFGVFQAVMPVVGYFSGRFFSRAISSVDHWIAFILLGLIGGHMLAEACTYCQYSG